MEISIVNIGNSKGIRIPKVVLEKYKMMDKIELILEEDQIVLRAKEEPRKGWENAFQQMHENGDDQLLIDAIFEDENVEEWN